MAQLQFGNILAFKGSSGSAVAFHTERLEVGQIDETAWDALAALQNSQMLAVSPQLSEAALELTSWSEAPADHVKSQRTTIEDKKIRSLIINVSQLCNLRCVYCYAGDGTYGSTKGLIDVKTADWQITQAIKRLTPGDDFQLCFFGGEPLLHPEAIYALVATAENASNESKVSVQFEIVTNGTLVSTEIAEYLAQKNFGVTVSIDGPAEIQNKSRPMVGKKESFEKAFTGIKRLVSLQEKLRFIKSMTVVGEHNLDLLKSFTFAESLGVPHITFNFATSDNDEVNSKLFVKSLVALLKELYDTGGEKRLRKFLWVDMLFDQLDEREKNLNFCLAGKTYVSLDTDNNWYACQRLTGVKKFQLGTKESGVLEQYQAPFSRDLVTAKDCQVCPVKNLCGGGCMATHFSKTGSHTTPDKTFCFRQNEFYKMGIEYYIKARSTEAS